MALLRIQNLTKSFGGLTAVDDVSFEVAEGTIKGVIGPNGAGKSTLFNCITGFERYDSGTVHFKEIALKPGNVREAQALGMSRTFQNTSLFDDMTVIENLMVPLTSSLSTQFVRAALRAPSHKRALAEAYEQAMVTLERFKLTDWKDVGAGELPAGMRRRVEVVRACCTEPALVMLDEPAAGLNATETNQLAEQIERIRNLGISVLIVEHDLSLVMRLCDELLVLDHGVKLAEGAPHIIQRDPAVIDAYLGYAR